MAFNHRTRSEKELVGAWVRVEHVLARLGETDRARRAYIVGYSSLIGGGRFLVRGRIRAGVLGPTIHVEDARQIGSTATARTRKVKAMVKDAVDAWMEA